MQLVLFILSFIVYEQVTAIVKCKPEKLQILNYRMVLKRSEPHTVSCRFVNCPGQPKIYYKWSLLWFTQEMQESTQKSLTINGYLLPIDQVFQTSFDLRLEVSHNVQFEYHSTVVRSIVFIPDEMNLRFVNGKKRYHLANTPLTVDGLTLSRDKTFSPTESPWDDATVNWRISPNVEYTTYKKMVAMVAGHLLEEKKEYRFQMIVRRHIKYGGDYSMISQLVKIVSNVLKINCLKNCVNPNAQEVTILKVFCRKYCFNNYYTWTSDESVPSDFLEFGNGTDKLLIKANTFKPGTRITFFVNTSSAIASYEINFEKDREMKDCSIFPLFGTSGITLFSILCDLEEENATLIVSQVFPDEKSSVILISNGTLGEKSFFYLAKGDPAIIEVKLQFSDYLEIKKLYEIPVKPYETLKPDTEQELLKVILGDPYESVLNLEDLKENPDELVQTINYLLDITMSVRDDASLFEHLFKHIALSLAGFVTDDINKSEQLLSIINRIQYKAFFSDTITSRILGDYMAVLSSKAEQVQLSELMPSSFLNRIADRLTALCENIIFLKNEARLPHVKKSTDPSIDEMQHERVKYYENMRNITINTLITLRNAGKIKLFRQIEGQSPWRFENEYLTYQYQKVDKSWLSEKVIRLNADSSPSIILSDSYINRLTEFSTIEYQLAEIDQSLFSWDPHLGESSTYVSFELLHEGYKLEINETFKIIFNISSAGYGHLSGRINPGFENSIIYRVYLEPDSAVEALFDVPKKSYFVTFSSCMCEYEDIVSGRRMRSFSEIKYRTMTFEPAQNSRVIYLCLMNLGTTPTDFRMQYRGLSCKYFDFKTGLWSTSGCQPLSEKNIEKETLTCECTHTTIFSGNAYLPLFENVTHLVNIEYFIEPVYNWLVIVLVCVILIIWIFMLIWSVFKDRRLENQNVLCKLDDNYPGDSHIYFVVITTGLFIDAGTTANVAFQLVGDKARSRVHLIKCACLKLLKRNSQDWLIVFAPLELGTIIKIRIWHDCTGRSPHWYCERIIVEELKSGLQYCFLVDQWLSLIWGDGAVYRELCPEESKHGTSLLTIFGVALRENIKENHPFISMFTRDPQSGFTSKERVSYAVSLLLLSMVTIALLYELPKGTPSDSIDTRPQFKITYQEVVVFLESLLILIPVSVLISLLFKKSNPRPVSKEEKFKDKYLETRHMFEDDFTSFVEEVSFMSEADRPIEDKQDDKPKRPKRSLKFSDEDSQIA